jgi:hypothetical protein
MKIVGYCALWSIAFALLVAICVILRQGHVEPPRPQTGEIAAGKAADATRTTAVSPASTPSVRAALPSV